MQTLRHSNVKFLCRCVEGPRQFPVQALRLCGEQEEPAAGAQAGLRYHTVYQYTLRTVL